MHPTSFFKQQGFYEKACRDASCLLSLLLLFVYILALRYHPYLLTQFYLLFILVCVTFLVLISKLEVWIMSIESEQQRSSLALEGA